MRMTISWTTSRYFYFFLLPLPPHFTTISLTTILFLKDGWIKEAIDHVKKEENEINKVNSTGLTPLLLALHGDHVDLVKALLDRGADTNIRDRSGYTALHRTSQTNKDEMMTMLINAGANIEITDNSGFLKLFLFSRCFLSTHPSNTPYPITTPDPLCGSHRSDSTSRGQQSRERESCVHPNICWCQRGGEYTRWVPTHPLCLLERETLGREGIVQCGC